MILGNLGLMLNIFSIVFVSLFMSLTIVSVVFNYSSEVLHRFKAKSRAKILWCIGVLPWFISIMSAGLLILPELWLGSETWLSSYIHWHHLYEFNILSWHGASVCVFSIIFIGICLSKLVRTIKTNTQLDQLNFFAKSTDSNQGLMIIDSPQRQAFTSGFFRPTSYMTTGLQEELSAQEASIIAQHELAHAGSYDPLRKFVFSLFAAFFPKTNAQKLNDAYSLALEQMADESVMHEINDETLISRTLLKASKLRNQVVSASMPPLHCQFTAHPLTLRIHYLLSDNKGQSFPFLMFILFAITLTTLSTLSVDLLHHGLEKFIAH